LRLKRSSRQAGSTRSCAGLPQRDRATQGVHVCRPRVSAHVDVRPSLRTETDIAIRGIDPLHGLLLVHRLTDRPDDRSAASSSLGPCSRIGWIRRRDRLDHETKSRNHDFHRAAAPVDARQRGTSSGCDVRRRVGARRATRGPPEPASIEPRLLDRRADRPRTRTPVPQGARTRERRMGRARASDAELNRPERITVASVRGEANSTASFAPPARPKRARAASAAALAPRLEQADAARDRHVEAFDGAEIEFSRARRRFRA